MADVDTTKVPDFDALADYLKGKREANGMDGHDVTKIEAWIAKLREWCEAKQRENAELHEALATAEWHEEIIDVLEDVPRGVRTFEEVMEMIS